MRSEILRLRLDQVDLAVGTVRLEVRTAENMDGRLIYLTAELYALLLGLWQQRQATLSQCSFVFTYRGAGFNRYKRSLVRACKKAGLTGKVAYDFRRTAVQNIVRAGITKRVFMQTAGHRTRCVFDRSHIVSDGDLKEVAGRLDRAFSPQTMTTRFDANLRTSNLWVALCPNHPQFLYDPVSDFRGLNSLFGETAGVSCMPAADRMPVG